MIARRFLRQVVCILWVLLSSLSLIAQPPSDPVVQALKNELERTRLDTARVHILLRLSNQYLPVSRSIQLDQTVALYHGSAEMESLELATQYAAQALKISQKINFLSGQAKAMLAMGRILIQKRENAKARDEIQNALQIFRSEKDEPGVADAYYLMAGSLHNSLADSSSSIDYLNKAIAIYKRQKDIQRQVWAYRELADLYFQQGKTKDALTLLLNTLQLQTNVQDATPQYTYIQLATVYARMSNFYDALIYAHKAVDTARALRDTSMIARFYQQTAMNHYQLQEYTAAKEYFERALAIYKADQNYFALVHNVNMVREILQAKNQNREALLYVTSNLPEIPSNQGDARNYATMTLAMAYAANGEYAKADSYGSLLPDPSSISYFTPIMKAGAHQDIGKLFVASHSYDKAQYHVKRALDILNQEGLRPKLLLSNIHYQLFLIDSATGNLPGAFSHYKEYTSLRSSIFNEAKSNQVASMEIQYNTEKKQKDIELLNRKAELQQEIIHSTKLSRNVIMGGGLMLLLLLGIIYNRYLLKQKSNRLLEERQKIINRKNSDLSVLIKDKDRLLGEKDWLMKEIHHRVKNNLQIIMSLLRTKMQYITNEESLPAFRESLDQVFAMSVIHEKLFQSNSLSGVNAADFIVELVNNLEESFYTHRRVSFVLDIESIEMDLSQAVLLGLIVNESVTNSLKHAFPGDTIGVVHISLKRVGADICRLEIEDNGVGLPKNFDRAKVNSFGMQIIMGLSQQLNGTFVLDSETRGVKSILEFPARKVTVKVISQASLVEDEATIS